MSVLVRPVADDTVSGRKGNPVLIRQSPQVLVGNVFFPERRDLSIRQLSFDVALSPSTAFLCDSISDVVSIGAKEQVSPARQQPIFNLIGSLFIVADTGWIIAGVEHVQFIRWPLSTCKEPGVAVGELSSEYSVAITMALMDPSPACRTDCDLSPEHRYRWPGLVAGSTTKWARATGLSTFRDELNGTTGTTNEDSVSAAALSSMGTVQRAIPCLPVSNFHGLSEERSGTGKTDPWNGRLGGHRSYPFGVIPPACFNRRGGYCWLAGDSRSVGCTPPPPSCKVTADPCKSVPDRVLSFYHEHHKGHAFVQHDGRVWRWNEDWPASREVPE